LYFVDRIQIVYREAVTSPYTINLIDPRRNRIALDNLPA